MGKDLFHGSAQTQRLRTRVPEVCRPDSSTFSRLLVRPWVMGLSFNVTFTYQIGRNALIREGVLVICSPFAIPNHFFSDLSIRVAEGLRNPCARLISTEFLREVG